MDYNKILSKKVINMSPSGIRKFFDLASKKENVISLGVGEPDFETPYIVKKAAIKSIQNGKTFYTSNSGLEELKFEISKYLDIKFNLKYNSDDEIYITVGGSEAIDCCIRALVNDGDEVIIPEPCFVAYKPLAELAGAKVVTIKTEVEDNFKLTSKQLKAAITDKTKILVLSYPNNPTGAILDKEDLEELAKILKGTDIIVLSDEIYAELTYGQKHISISSIEGMRERTVIVSGFSKAYAMTGWRVGYACGPEPLIKNMLKIHQFAIMCAPTNSQFAAIQAISKCDSSIDVMRKEYDMRRKLIVNGFREIGFSCFEPKGAFYIFPNIRSTKMMSEDFCHNLLEKQNVAVVPGTAFGESGEGFIRVSYSYSVDHIKNALERIKVFKDEI